MNELLSPAQQVLTMTSREIADLTQKRHDNVMRTIETLYERRVIGLPHFEEVLNDGPGPVLVKQYRLQKRDTYVLVAQLSPEFTAALVDRWQELESKQAKPVELSRMDILKLAMESEQARIEAEQKLALAAPKVEFVEKYVQAESGVMNLRDVCKMLGAKQNEFTAWLLERGIMYRTVPHAPLTAAANHVHLGRFVAKTGIAENTEKSHAYVHYRFTSKGVEWIAGEWAKHRVALVVAEKAVAA